MERHATFRFSPKPLSSDRFPNPLIERARGNAPSLAIAALAEMAGQSGPVRHSTEPVTIDVPYTRLTEADKSARVIETGVTSHGGRRMALLFEDRSILVGQSLQDGTSRLRILPINLHLKPQFTYNAHGKHCQYKVTDLFEEVFRCTHWLQPELKSRLIFELDAWAKETDRAPLMVSAPLGTPISGSFGVDLPAPGPGLQGQPYDWPAALMAHRATPDLLEAAEEFLRQAWIRALLDFPTVLGEPGVSVEFLSQLPTQYAHKSGPKLSLSRPVSAAGLLSLGEERQLESLLKRLIKHPSAPTGLDDLIHCRWFMTSKGKLKIAGGQLYLGNSNINPSAHERMAACARFIDIERAA